MAQNDFNESIRTLLSGLDGFVSSKTVVGTPVKVNDTVLLPLMDVEVGVGAGAFGNKALGTGGGMGAKMTPSAVLVIQNGASKLINIKNQDSLTKVLDMVPEVMDRITGKKVKKDPKVDEAVDEIRKQAEEGAAEQ
ncbi:MAG: GerW family sporulation protein [Lachnospiraceae bacterium]|nr:GerW family sporulation protein [Lachnospiraceae bacterium]